MLYGKPFVSISIQDVINNEGDILYEIKKAIVYGATKHLYFDLNEYQNNSDLQSFYNAFNYKEVNKPTPDQMSDEEQIKIYFEDLII